MIVFQITSARFPKGKLNYAYVMEADEKTDKVNWIKVEVQSQWNSDLEGFCDFVKYSF